MKGWERNAAAVRTHKWSSLSIGLSVVLLLVGQAVVRHRQTAGTRAEYSVSAERFVASLAWGMLASAVLAVIGLTKERPLWLALLALGLAGFVLFAWSYTA